jgi:putative transposase
MTAQGGALRSAWLRAPPQNRRAIFPMCYGPEFAGRMLDQWAYLNGVEIDFSRPGKPTDTDVVEKPYPAGAGIFFLNRDLVGALVRHRAVKSAYASSAFSTRARSAARRSGIL